MTDTTVNQSILPADQTPSKQLSVVIGLLLIGLVVICALAITISWQDMAADPTTAVTSSSQQLSTAQAKTTQNTPVEIPNWLYVLIALFSALQIIALIIAAGKARRQPLSLRDVKLISFLCETPMYIGLLGSLLGVCLNQFITGSLAAPLAYLTTITGILLFLFAKLTIWTTLPERSMGFLND